MKMSKTYKYVLTFSLFFCYFAYGVNFYVVGPTLIELAGLFQSTIEQICLIYTVRSAGYTFGSLSGFLFKYINRQLIFVFFLVVMGVTLMLMPHAQTITNLFILAGINGFSIGSFDTAINVWILEMWAEDSGPFMQALHFTYGIGSFVAPLICEPFLSTEPMHGSHGPPPSSSVSTTVAPITTTTTIPSTTAQFLKINDSKLLDLLVHMESEIIDPIDYLIYIPYTIAGAVTIFAAFIVLALYYVKKYEPPTREERRLGRNRSPSEIEMDHHDDLMIEQGLEPPPRRRKLPLLTIWLVVMGSLFLTFFVGMEQMHLQFLPTFAVNTELAVSPSTAAMMSSAAALAFTIGRCLSIPLAIKVKPVVILYSNHFLMLLGTIILAIYANNSEKMMWVGNVIMGVGFSSVYASIYAFLEQQIRVTNRIGSIFVFAGGLTAAASPSVVGQYIEANPLILVWFNLACCLLCLTIFVIIHITVHLQVSKKRQRKTMDYDCGPQQQSSNNNNQDDNHDDQTNMMIMMVQQQQQDHQTTPSSTPKAIINNNKNDNRHINNKDDIDEQTVPIMAATSEASTSTVTSVASTSGMVRPSVHAAAIVPYFDASDDEDSNSNERNDRAVARAAADGADDEQKMLSDPA